MPVTRSNDYNDISDNDPSTDVTGAELEELTDGSETTLHSHAGGSGDVVGPASSTDNAIARYDGTTGKLIQNSGVQVDDAGAIIPAVSGRDIGTSSSRWDSLYITNIYGDQSNDLTISNSHVGSTAIDISSAIIRLIGDTKVNTIDEYWTDSGVTIETVLVKDGLVDGRDVATDGTKLDGIESGATADQTAGEIKTAYESNTDTNAFTDSEQTKLAGIESGAEVNNISDANATDLTDGGTTTLHSHDKAVNDLTDATITTPADNEVLAYDNGTSTWINQTPAEAGLAETSHTHTESDITDLGDYGDVSGPASSTDTALVRFDGTTGKLVRNSTITVSGTDSGTNNLVATGELEGIRLVANTTLGTDGVSTNGITEYSTGSGVTVDNVLIKDGQVDGRDVATDGTKLDGIESGATADQTDAEIETAINNQLTGTVVGTSDTQTLTNKTLDTPTIYGWGGWQSAEESWTYSSYSSTTRIAQITVPTDATTKYTPGMRVMFDQTTDGTKYGIIHKVEATVLHVFMHEDYDFDNETISNNSYSTEKAPLNFDADPSKWELQWTAPGAEDETTGLKAYQQLGTSELALGVGAWHLTSRAYIEWRFNSSIMDCWVALSTSTTSSSDNTMEDRRYFSGLNATGHIRHETSNFQKNLLVSSGTTTHYLIGRNNSGGSEIDLRADSYIRAVSNYL